jgi:hypothetical protein
LSYKPNLEVNHAVKIALTKEEKILLINLEIFNPETVFSHLKNSKELQKNN